MFTISDNHNAQQGMSEHLPKRSDQVYAWATELAGWKRSLGRKWFLLGRFYTWRPHFFATYPLRPQYLSHVCRHSWGIFDLPPPLSAGHGRGRHIWKPPSLKRGAFHLLSHSSNGFLLRNALSEARRWGRWHCHIVRPRQSALFLMIIPEILTL